jgi:hypothetical protein
MGSLPTTVCIQLPVEPAKSDAAVWTREEAIHRLRRALLRLSDGESSMCRIAAELGVFCRGFRRWPDSEFHHRFRPALGVSTHLSRAQMERLADLWQQAEQIRVRAAIACDAAAFHPGSCRGWEEFSNDALARFCDEVLGRNVTVVESSNKAQTSQTLPETRVPIDSRTRTPVGSNQETPVTRVLNSPISSRGGGA